MAFFKHQGNTDTFEPTPCTRASYQWYLYYLDTMVVSRHVDVSLRECMALLKATTEKVASQIYRYSNRMQTS
jgi:hypothetical protein